MKKLLISVMAILLAVGLVGAGTFAYFNDTETSTGNSFTAGTLDLKVGGQDDPNVFHITIPKIEPGYDSNIWARCKVYNTGTLDGKFWVEISPIINNDNGCNEPECLAEGGTWDPETETCTGNCGDGEGELGEYLTIQAEGVRNLPIRLFGDYMPGRGPLNYWGGKTSPVYDLPAGGYAQMQFRFKLPGGTGNIVQSDSVEFDLIFHLDQVTP